jgi:hypothetical protein
VFVPLTSPLRGAQLLCDLCSEKKFIEFVKTVTVTGKLQCITIFGMQSWNSAFYCGRGLAGPGIHDRMVTEGHGELEGATPD